SLHYHNRNLQCISTAIPLFPAVLSRSNQTELMEPPPLSRSNIPANPVSLPPYRSNIIILFDAKPIFLVIFISQSVQFPLRNMNSPFGFHEAVNRESTANSTFSFSICCGNIVSPDSNKRFVYDVGAYNSDDDKADQNGMRDFLNEMADMMNLCIVIPILIINVLARVSICLLCNLRKPTAVVLSLATEVKTSMEAVLIKRKPRCAATTNGVPAAAVTDPPIRPLYISPKVRSYGRFKDSSDLRRNPFVPRAKNEQDRDGGTQVPKEPVNELRLPKRKRPNLQQEQP
ncbi:hypothetical protein HID58_054709, partial [Brassica napus]